MKPYNDINGDTVTLNFEDIMRAAEIAVYQTKCEVERRVSDIQYSTLEGNYTKARIAAEDLTKQAANLHRSIITLHSLRVLSEGRETLRIFNSPVKIENLINDK